MQKTYVNHAMNDLYTLNKIFLPIFGPVNETNMHEL